MPKIKNDINHDLDGYPDQDNGLSSDHVRESRRDRSTHEKPNEEVSPLERDAALRGTGQMEAHNPIHESLFSVLDVIVVRY